MLEPSLSGNHALDPDSGDLCPKRSAPEAALSQGDYLLPLSALPMARAMLN